MQSFSSPYFTVFGRNTGKWGPEKLRIWTFFTQCELISAPEKCLLNISLFDFFYQLNYSLFMSFYVKNEK